jgi:hypothetical protein
MRPDRLEHYPFVQVPSYASLQFARNRRLQFVGIASLVFR